MSKIRIKNFGPIKNGLRETLPDGSVNEWMDIKKVTVFIGNQGSGKSTVAKAIASLVWLEKALNRGDVSENEANTLNFFHKLFGYLRLGGEYFKDDTQIDYRGDLYGIRYDPKQQRPMVKRIEEKPYVVPKIMYIPSERTFLSVVREAYDVKGLPPALFEFAEEFRRSQKELGGQQLELPLQGYKYIYDEKEDRSFVIGADHKIDLLEASSGFQSLIPLYVVTVNLAHMTRPRAKNRSSALSVDQSLRMGHEINSVMSKDTLSDSEKVRQVQAIQAKYKNDVFLNIVEEPEQNLFPSSQHSMLNSLIHFNNLNEGNKLVMTTHSPYLINYLTLAVKADKVCRSLAAKKFKIGDREYDYVNEIVPLSSTVRGSDVVIYEMNEKDGTIKKLEDYNGLPSDENELNSELEDTNELFAQLQEIEKGWR